MQRHLETGRRAGNALSLSASSGSYSTLLAFLKNLLIRHTPR